MKILWSFVGFIWMLLGVLLAINDIEAARQSLMLGALFMILSEVTS